MKKRAKRNPSAISAANRATLQRLRDSSPNSVQEAKNLFRDFRDMEPGGVGAISIQLPRAVIEMGHCVEIAYSVVRNGKKEYYRHQFAAGSQPVLVAGPKRGDLYLIGGRFRVTGRGIVDLDAHGEEIE